MKVGFAGSTKKWIHAICRPVKEKSPAGHFLYGTIQDVTERKEAEKQLAESREKLRGIIENSTNMFYSHTPDHVLTYVSPQVKEILGYKEEEALKRWMEMATDHPANKQGFELTEKAIRTGKAQPPYELQLRHKDGHPVWVEVHEAPVVEDGKIVAIVGSLTDITGRYDAAKQIRFEQTLFHSLMEMVPLAVYFKDLDGRFVRVNRLAALHVGADQTEELIGKSDFDFFPEEEARSYLEQEKEILQNGQALQIEEAGQNDHWGLTTKAPWHDESGKIAGTFGISLDITDRKKAEKALTQKMKELEFFNKAAVGRELRMVELKQEINALCKELGKPEKYD